MSRPEELPFLAVPISEKLARQWLFAEIKDSEIVATAPRVWEVLLIVNLPNKKAWRDVVFACRELLRNGGYGAIGGTANPICKKHYEMAGAKCVMTEMLDGKEYGRYYISHSKLIEYFCGGSILHK